MYKQETDVSSHLKQTKEARQIIGNNRFQELDTKNNDSRAVVLSLPDAETL